MSWASRWSIWVLWLGWIGVAHAAPSTSPTSQPVASAAALETLRREVQELRRSVQALKREAEQREEPAAPDEPVSQRRLLSIYGFFDLTFHKPFLPRDSYLENLLQDTSSFLVNRVNVYLQSQLTQTFGALVELRFSFSPLGDIKQFGVPALSLPYLRENTTVTDYWTGGRFALNGVAIERVHLTWQPREWFGVIAGRFLTPFGIWNVDHGSPVIIAARLPFVLLREVIPLAQTGVQIFGKVFTSSRSYLEYAFSVSNGRGPIESVYDLDNNKGLGLRLRWTFEGQQATLALGAYGYWGNYTDKRQDITSFSPYTVSSTVTERYTEASYALDVLFKYRGVQLQAEMVKGLVDYGVRPTLRGGGFQPNSMRYASYILGAYELPLGRWLGDVRVRPYVLFEYEDLDQLSTLTGEVLTWGLNVQPLTWVTLKAEGFFVNAHSTTTTRPTHFYGFTAQTAVSF